MVQNKNKRDAFKVSGPYGTVLCACNIEDVIVYALDKLGRRCKRKGWIRITLPALHLVYHETMKRATALAGKE
jgi:hypothetical protein